jgi:hypothetical protein
MGLINRKLSGVETAFLMADEKLSHISSTLIRGLARWGVTLPGFVPESITGHVYAKMGVPYIPGSGHSGAGGAASSGSAGGVAGGGQSGSSNSN